MIRILHCVNDMKRAGLETMIMNYYRKIDRSKIQFDFLTHRDKPGDYEEEIKKLGGKIYRAPRLYPKNYFRYFKFMKKFFSEHPEYKIVHSHIDSMSFLPLLASKKSNVPFRISHSHSNSIEKDYKYVLKEIFRLMIPMVANKYMACSNDAARYLFGNREATIVVNAIDANRFYFDNEIRDKKRKELGIKNEFVIGHVGRMDDVKNHKYLLNIFYEINKIDGNCLLLLVGSGKNYDAIKKQAKELNVEDKTIFLGNREDANELYQAMDILIFPSMFEGLGIVPVEAQFTGLPCLLSNALPREVCFTDDCLFLNIKDNPLIWALKSLEIKKANQKRVSKYDCRYDISNSYKLLERYYQNLYDEVK